MRNNQSISCKAGLCEGRSLGNVLDQFLKKYLPEFYINAVKLAEKNGDLKDTLVALERLGHKVARRRPGIHDGKTQLIVRNIESGVLMGASDPRGDGQAAAW